MGIQALRSHFNIPADYIVHRTITHLFIGTKGNVDLWVSNASGEEGILFTARDTRQQEPGFIQAIHRDQHKVAQLLSQQDWVDPSSLTTLYASNYPHSFISEEKCYQCLGDDWQFTLNGELVGFRRKFYATKELASVHAQATLVSREVFASIDFLKSIAALANAVSLMENHKRLHKEYVELCGQGYVEQTRYDEFSNDVFAELRSSIRWLDIRAAIDVLAHATEVHAHLNSASIPVENSELARGRAALALADMLQKNKVYRRVNSVGDIEVMKHQLKSIRNNECLSNYLETASIGDLGNIKDRDKRDVLFASAVYIEPGVKPMLLSHGLCVWDANDIRSRFAYAIGRAPYRNGFLEPYHAENEVLDHGIVFMIDGRNVVFYLSSMIKHQLSSHHYGFSLHRMENKQGWPELVQSITLESEKPDASDRSVVFVQTTAMLAPEHRFIVCRRNAELWPSVISRGENWLADAYNAMRHSLNHPMASEFYLHENEIFDGDTLFNLLNGPLFFDYPDLKITVYTRSHSVEWWKDKALHSVKSHCKLNMVTWQPVADVDK